MIPTAKAEAIEAVRRILVEKEFGTAGNEVVIEEYLEGEECSILAFTDGYTIFTMPPAQDHKRLLEDDQVCRLISPVVLNSVGSKYWRNGCLCSSSRCIEIHVG